MHVFNNCKYTVFHCYAFWAESIYAYAHDNTNECGNKCKKSCMGDKHVMVINKHLSLQLLNMMQSTLCRTNNINLTKVSRKKLKIQSLVQEEENHKP